MATIRPNFRMVSVLNYIKQLMNDNPNLTQRETRHLAAGTKRNRACFASQPALWSSGGCS